MIVLPQRDLLRPSVRGVSSRLGKRSRGSQIVRSRPSARHRQSGHMEGGIRGHLARRRAAHYARSLEAGGVLCRDKFAN